MVKLRPGAVAIGRLVGADGKPRANVELFRKYEADIKKYAMHGLAYIGL